MELQSNNEKRQNQQGPIILMRKKLWECLVQPRKKSPNATLCYISCKMRALKNRTLKYLDNLDKDTKDNVLKKAVLLGQEQRKKRKGNQIDLRKELLRRQLEKQQAKDTSTRKKLEHRLKSIDIDKIRDEFHDLEDSK